MDLDVGPELDISTACSLGDEEFVKLILDSKPDDVHVKNNCGWTPLMYACWGSYERVVLLLLHAGANTLEFNDNGQSPMLLAAISGCLNIVKHTFQKSILDCVDIKGKSALFYAVEFSFQDIVSYLLMKGANVNLSCEGMTPLMVAAVNGHQPLVELLLDNAAQTQLHNDQGLTAQQLAKKHGYHDVAKILEIPLKDFTDLKGFLESFSLDKYWPTFESHNINLQTFLNLNENDLKSLGIKLLGPRRKMTLAIAAFKQWQSNV